MYQSRLHVGKRKTRLAKCWDTTHEIVDVDADAKVDFVYLCTVCKNVVYNGRTDGNTMAFNRHICFAMDGQKEKKRLLISKEEKEKLKIAASQFVVKDIRPYQAVEREGLLDLCTAAMRFGQKYPKADAQDFLSSMPSRHGVQRYVAVDADSVKKDIGNVLQAVKEHNGLGATTDCWTDNYRHHAYLCITIHGSLIEKGQIKTYRYVISMDILTDLVKTKEVIMAAIFRSFARYGYSENDVARYVTFISDRGPNIRYGLIKYGLDHLYCYMHMLNNISGKMLSVPDVKQMINNGSELCAYMKNTGLNSRLPKTLKLFSPSRFNGVCIMFGSILEADFNLITEILLEKQRLTKTDLVSKVTALNKQEIRPVHDFLATIKKWSDLLEGDLKETMHFVWPAFLNIQKLLVEDMSGYDEKGTALVELMKDEGRKYLRKNMNDFQPTDHHKFAVVLHPLMRKLPNIDPVERQQVYNQIETKLKDFGDSDEATVQQDEIRPAQPVKKSTNTLLSEFFEEDSMDDDLPNIVKPSELQRYLEMQIKISPDNFDLKRWWFEKKDDFPALTKMFIRYSCMPATSAPSERNFSEAGLIITNRRNAILPENVHNLIIARNVMKNK